MKYTEQQVQLAITARAMQDYTITAGLKRSEVRQLIGDEIFPEVTREELDAGLAILDEAVLVASKSHAIGVPYTIGKVDSPLIYHEVGHVATQAQYHMTGLRKR